MVLVVEINSTLVAIELTNLMYKSRITKLVLTIVLLALVMVAHVKLVSLHGTKNNLHDLETDTTHTMPLHNSGVAVLSLPAPPRMVVEVEVRIHTDLSHHDTTVKGV